MSGLPAISRTRRMAMLLARRPAVVFSNGYGDHLVNLPALRALATLFQGRLSLVCQTGARELFFSDLDLRRVCEVEMDIVAKGKLFDVETAVATIGPCDCLVSLNPWHSPALDLLRQRLQPDDSIGFHSSFGVVLPRDFSKHSAELAFDAPRCLDPALEVADFLQPPRLHPKYTGEAARLLTEAARGARVLVVHPDTSPDKMWPARRWAELLDRFLANRPDWRAILVGLDDLGLQRGRDRVVSHCGAIPLGTAMALTAAADLFVGVDSFFMHVADFFRVPAAGLFGPTGPLEWGFLAGPNRELTGAGAMTAIDVDQTLRALDSLIHKRTDRLIPELQRNLSYA